MRYICAIAVRGGSPLSRRIYISNYQELPRICTVTNCTRRTVGEWNIRVSCYRCLRFYLTRRVTACNIEIINSRRVAASDKFHALTSRRDGKWRAANGPFGNRFEERGSRSFRKRKVSIPNKFLSSSIRGGCTRCCIWMRNSSRLCTPGRICEGYWIMCRAARSRRSRRCAARGWIPISIVRKQEVIRMRDCEMTREW